MFHLIPTVHLPRVCAITCALSLAAQSPTSWQEVGQPLVRSFGPRDYGADPQNWSIVQSSRGLTYAANSLGVLEYDGERWRLLSTRLGTSPRALARDAQDRILVGAQGEFGYLVQQPLGSARYVPLEGDVPADIGAFGTIWSVSAGHEGALFLARKALFHWNGSHLGVLRPAGEFFMTYAVQGRQLVQDLGRGLLELKQGQLHLVPGGHLLAGLKPRFVVPWEVAGRPALLWGTRAEGLALLMDGRVVRVQTPADGLLKDAILYDGQRLSDGTLAMATIQGGVICLDAQLRQMRILKRDLSNESAYCLREDPRGGLWIGRSRGIDQVGWPPTLTHFAASEGLQGVPVDIRRHQGALYVSSHLGVSRLVPAGSDGAPPRFDVIPGIKGQCWTLLPDGPALLVANYDGIYEIRQGRARQIAAPGHTTSLVKHPHNPNQLFAGTLRGLFVLERATAAAPWRVSRRVEAVPDEIQTLAMGEDGALWVGCDAPTALRITFHEGQAKVLRLGPQHGLPAEGWCFTTLLQGQPRIYTPSGLFQFDPASGRCTPDPRTRTLVQGDVPLHRVASGPDGQLWVSRLRTGTLLGRSQRGMDGLYAPPAPAAWASAPVYTLFPEAGGVLWFGGVDGLHRLGPLPSALLGEQVLLRGITPRAGGALKDPLHIPYHQNALRFDFALPPAGPLSPVQYQVWLEGLDAGWSAWSAESYRDVTNLRWGEYRLKVRARRGPTAPEYEVAHSFRVLRPWYHQPWAYALYALGLAAVLGSLHRLRVRVLQRRNEDLEARITEATHSLRERETHLAELNLQLKTLNDQKTRFLGIVSHDLKAPLHGIALAAESLRTTRDPELIAATAEAIGKESLAMGTLVDRFLDATARESGHLRVRAETLDLETVLLEALDRHAAHAAAKGIPMDLAGDVSDLRGHADPLLLAQILDNFLSNALKFSSPGQAVHLHAEVRGERVRLAVMDQGPGLHPDELPHLFEPFSRQRAQPTGGESSQGLGLSITRQLAEAMGGTVGAEGAPDRGATFWVELPVAPPVG